MFLIKAFLLTGAVLSVADSFRNSGSLSRDLFPASDKSCACWVTEYDSCACWVTEYESTTLHETSTKQETPTGYDTSTGYVSSTKYLTSTAYLVSTECASSVTVSATPSPSPSSVSFRPFRGSSTDPLKGLPEGSVPVGVGYWQSSNESLYYVNRGLLTNLVLDSEGATVILWDFGNGAGTDRPGNQNVLYFTKNGQLWFSQQGGAASRVPEFIPQHSQPIGAGIFLGPDQRLYNMDGGVIPGTEGTTQAVAYWYFRVGSPEHIRINFEINGNGTYFVAASPRWQINTLTFLPEDRNLRMLGHGAFQSRDNNAIYMLKGTAVDADVSLGTVHKAANVTAPVKAYYSSAGAWAMVVSWVKDSAFCTVQVPESNPSPFCYQSALAETAIGGLYWQATGGQIYDASRLIGPSDASTAAVSLLFGIDYVAP